MTPDWAGPWDVVVVGGRLAGAVTAHSLAPYAERVLIVERSRPGSFWPQQVTWDRPGNLIWADLGLTDTVHRCGAPKQRGQQRYTLGVGVGCTFPTDDEHCYRMSVSREVLDPALAARAAAWPGVRLLQPARVTGAIMDGGRVTGVRVLHDGVQAEVSATLVVFADGRLSRHPEEIGAPASVTVPSPWTALISYFRDLPLAPDRAWYVRLPGSMLVVTPTGPGQWCVSVSMHAGLLRERDRHPIQVYREVIAADPIIGPAVAAGTAITSVGGAGKMRMHRRPMTGPGWCLVGDSGLHLDPLSALGAHAALTTVRLLRDRVADLGTVSADPTRYADLSDRRDALLAREWEHTRRVISAYQPGPEAMERVRHLAGDEDAVQADVRVQMGLPARGPRGGAAGTRSAPLTTTGASQRPRARG
ncbi:MAG TPA: FAD-dependent monooxygenase [Kineosporiaceae bacterium]